MSTTGTGLTYKDAGVDIEAADRFVEGVSDLAASTHTAGVVKNASAFAGLFRPDLAGLEDPLIASTCDGVGTKLLVAHEVGRFEGLGQDLVAMNVNDLLPLGARPLFFLDYIATGALDPADLQAVVRGIAGACKAVGCALLGGETAEMPGLYAPGHFDLAGFAVGLVDGARLPAPETVTPGDVVLGLPSTGVHSNGFSLARRALEGRPLDEEVAPGVTLGDELLEPTALYVAAVLDLQQRAPVKAGAHITGGGILGRGARLAHGHRLVLDPAALPPPPVFARIAEAGGVAPAEMGRTFNMGIGYLAVLTPEAFASLGELPGAWRELGRVEARGEGDPAVELGAIRG